MRGAHFEVTYRNGKPLAAYFAFPAHARRKVARTRRVEPGLVIDFDSRGQPLGIEITAPSQLSLAALNRVLHDLGLARLRRVDLAPLRVA